MRGNITAFWYALLDGNRDYRRHTIHSALTVAIPLIRADALRAISKESKKMDGTTYLVPDYGKFKSMLEGIDDNTE